MARDPGGAFIHIPGLVNLDDGPIHARRRFDPELDLDSAGNPRLEMFMPTGPVADRPAPSRRFQKNWPDPTIPPPPSVRVQSRNGRGYPATFGEALGPGPGPGPAPAPQPVRPNPGTEQIPTGAVKQCKNLIFLQIDGVRHALNCQIPELPGEHPNQPHMARLQPVEGGDEIFIGWYHRGEGAAAR